MARERAPDGFAEPRPKAPHPFALAAAAAVSLAAFAAAGWVVRSLREGERSGAPPLPSPSPASVARVAPSSSEPGPGPHARGRLVFQVHCARCHGPEGRGDGPDASALRPPPRDLTAGPWRTPSTRDAVRRTVAEGIPGTMMN